jgi:hypothetical protein
MARRVIINFDLGDVHRIRSFGEELYHACLEDGWASISLGEIDRATTQLGVIVRSTRKVRRIVRMIEDLLRRHSLANVARVSEAAIIVQDESARESENGGKKKL